jgi:Terpene synthase family 2, C-terminal metal binding
MPQLSDLRLPETPAQPERRILAEVRRRTLDTCLTLGMIREDRMSVQKYLAGRFELLAALTYPDADVEELTLCNDFFMYLFYVDDQAEEDENYGKRPDALAHYFERHIDALRDGRLASPDDPAGRLLLDIRARVLNKASEHWLERFVTDVREYLLHGTLAGARHWTAGTIPTLDEYVRQRLFDSAGQCTQDMIEVAGGGELPQELVEDADVVELRRLCTNVVAFTNDLVSYSKEVRDHNSPNNLVCVVMAQERVGFERAAARSIALINDDVAAFERISKRLRRAEIAGDVRLERYLRGQRAWMSGNLQWSLSTGRYADPNSPFAELRTNSGVRAQAH